MKTFPIVLAHGIARFDVLMRAVLPAESAFDDATHYFRRIRSTLEAEGFEVHRPQVPWAAGVQLRARSLWEAIKRVPSPRVHIIAHSMGGLDARHMLFDFPESAERVASIVTIGTPHLGTSFADFGLELGRDALSLLSVLGIDEVDGFRDLSTDACLEFDERARSSEESSGVLFRTYAGAQPLWTVFAPLKLSWLVIRERERHLDGGRNDGLVSVHSARWRPRYFRGVIDADHLNQIGWCDPDEVNLSWLPRTSRDTMERQRVEEKARNLYVEIARGLADKFPLHER